ncbi:class I SAM-dependent DNA methyltransferase [Yoonia sp. 208BN28-4]|uniref:class I SAM-dependent DNA methyltransferase n=1 Tax=Yoonia sp. 208BN28-4 TaxID=3126505 RepID=UPI0030A21985
MTDKKDMLRPQLWTRRPVQDTIDVYADWAESYERDVVARGYRTPDRIAAALVTLANPKDPMLDFGCGTGLAAVSLHNAGFSTLDGTDVTPEMLAQAQAAGLYRKTWLSDPGELSFGRGAYPVIVAAGVISLGAAPPDLLGPLVAKLTTGQLLAFSYNEPTLSDEGYIAALDDEIASGRATVVFRENGPHLDDVGMTSDVIILRRT